MNPFTAILVLGLIAWSLLGIAWLSMAFIFTLGLALCAARRVKNKFRMGGDVAGEFYAFSKRSRNRLSGKRSSVLSAASAAPMRESLRLNPKLIRNMRIGVAVCAVASVFWNFNTALHVTSKHPKTLHDTTRHFKSQHRT